jgi:RHS repeat-associated protein
MGCLKLAYKNPEHSLKVAYCNPENFKNQDDSYYPFGLTMTGISSKSAGKIENKYKYNGKDLQNKEFSDGSGLEEYDFGHRILDPQLGRFWQQDAFADNFNTISPYQFAANNPITNIDINGDSTWVTTTTVKNKDGTTTITNTTHVTGKVLDLAGIKKGGACNSRSATADLASDINSAFNSQLTSNVVGTEEYVYNFDVQFTVANSMDDVSESDHLLVVVDAATGQADPKLGGGDAGGWGRDEGKISYMTPGSWKYMVKAGVHEIGHNLGLDHVENGSNNFMSYDENANHFTRNQIIGVFNRSNHPGELNQGSNSERSISNSNNWIFHTSTNEEPYKLNTHVGDRIPNIIKPPKKK